MLFKSQVLTQASGSVGGLTYSHNAGGMYTRARTIPVNSNTVYQQAVRNNVAQLAVYWQAELSAAEREAWENYATQVPLVNRLGDSRPISGIAMFIKCNSVRLQAGLAIVESGPTVYSLASLTAPTFAVDASDDNVAVGYTNTDGWAREVGGALLVYASRPQPATINYFKGPYRYIGKQLGAATPPSSPVTLSLAFPVNQNDRVFFKVVAVRADGRVSAPFRGYDDAGA